VRQDLTILGLHSTHPLVCLWALSPSPASGCQPSLLLSTMASSQSPLRFLPAWCCLQPRAWKPRSLWAEGEEGSVAMAVLPGGLWHNYSRLHKWFCFLRGVWALQPRPQLWLGDLGSIPWVTLVLSFLVCKMSKTKVPAPYWTRPPHLERVMRSPGAGPLDD
jgi:hypothetical protein